MLAWVALTEHWLTVVCETTTMMEVAGFGSTLGFKPNKKASIVTMSMSALPHMPNPAAVGLWQGESHLWEWFLPKLAQMKASWFNQGFWLRWLQWELWGLGIRLQCRLWHSYKIHKYFHSNYVSSQTSNREHGVLHGCRGLSETPNKTN